MEALRRSGEGVKAKMVWGTETKQDCDSRHEWLSEGGRTDRLVRGAVTCLHGASPVETGGGAQSSPDVTNFKDRRPDSSQRWAEDAQRPWSSGPCCTCADKGHICSYLQEQVHLLAVP